MKSYKQLVNEVLTKSTPAGEWIKDFVDSDNPKFAGKSAAKRKQMALAAYYAKEREQANESAAVSQNSTAEVDMNEERDVHVNDGSKYDEEPHPKDVEHVMAGVKKYGGKHAGNSDKGVYFRFKSKDEADSFRAHVNKCPHKSCDADHVNEAVEYKGIGTDVVDKKKKLNPQPNFTTDKKQVKDFKEEAEQIDELSKTTLQSYRDKAAKDVGRAYAIHQDPYKKTNKDDMRKLSNRVKGDERAEIGLKKEDIQLDEISKKTLGSYVNKAEKEEDKYQQNYTKLRNIRDKTHGKFSDDTPHMTDLDRKYVNRANGVYTAKQKLAKEEAEHINELDKKTIGSYAKKATKDLKWQQTMRPFDAKRISNREKGIDKAIDKLTKEEAEQIDELSKDTLASYAKKASHDARIKQHVAADFKSKKAHARNPRKKETWDSIAKKYQSQAWKREKGHDKAVDKLAGTKTKPSRPGDIYGKSYTEEVQIDEVSKSTLMRYIPKASRDVADHVAMAKERQVTMAHATHAGNYDMAKKESGKSQISFKKAMQRLKGIDAATKKLGTQKEEVEHIEEATVASRKYDWGTMKTVHHGKSFSIPLHPEHHQPIAKLKHGESHSFKDETGAKWKATRDNDTVHFHGGSYGTQKTSVPHSSLQESRGHKVLNTFFKNREVAQRAYQGNPAKDAEVAQGGGSPADQGIAAAKKDAEKLKKESVNPALMAILKKRQEAQKKKAEDKKKVNEAKTPVVHAAPPKKTKSTAKEYASASIPGTKRVAHAKPDDNEVGGGTATRIAEDQYTSEYKIKQFVDPVTGENKQRKVRPHRINFKASKMHGEPAQQDAPGDYGIKEGFDDYSSIAKELVKRHGKNVTAKHVKDFADERDTHRGLDHAEVMHHVKKLSEDDKVYDEKWKTVNFKDFTKGAK